MGFTSCCPSTCNAHSVLKTCALSVVVVCTRHCQLDIFYHFSCDTRLLFLEKRCGFFCGGSCDSCQSACAMVFTATENSMFVHRNSFDAKISFPWEKTCSTVSLMLLFSFFQWRPLFLLKFLWQQTSFLWEQTCVSQSVSPVLQSVTTIEVSAFFIRILDNGLPFMEKIHFLDSLCQPC